MKKIEFYETLKGIASGGTFSTFMHSMNNPPPKSLLGYDPLCKI